MEISASGIEGLEGNLNGLMASSASLEETGVGLKSLMFWMYKSETKLHLLEATEKDLVKRWVSR